MHFTLIMQLDLKQIVTLMDLPNVSFFFILPLNVFSVKKPNNFNTD